MLSNNTREDFRLVDHFPGTAHARQLRLDRPGMHQTSKRIMAFGGAPGGTDLAGRQSRPPTARTKPPSEYLDVRRDADIAVKPL
jgi:hypothetical protein